MKFHETVVVSGGLLVQQVTVFATGILIARHLGAASFGTLGTIKSLSSVLLIVTPLGLDLALLKHASFYHDRLGELSTTSRALRLIVAALNFCLLAVVASWLGHQLQLIYRDSPNFSRLCVITMVGLVFAADVQISGALYRVFNRVIAYAVIVNFAQPCLRLALSAVVIFAGGGVEGIVWVNTAVLAYSFAAIAVDERKKKITRLVMPLQVVAGKVGTILGESLWMGMSLLVYQAIRLVDILILAALTTPQITGEYTAMSSVSQLIQIYPIAISQTLGPRIALFYKTGDMAAITMELRGYLRKASMLGGFLFAGVAVFGTDLDLVFGKGFVFPWLLPFLLASGWFVSATLAPLGYVLSMTGRHRQELAILTAGAGLLVICLLAFIPLLAAIGAALSVAIVFVAVNAARCAYVIRVLSLNPLRWKDLLPPVGFLAIALVCRQTGTILIDRNIITLVAECLAYAIMAAALYVATLADPAEMLSIRAFARRLRIS
jgi:O-antigen/teichoic acid export membrane protein